MVGTSDNELPDERVDVLILLTFMTVPLRLSTTALGGDALAAVLFSLVVVEAHVAFIGGRLVFDAPTVPRIVISAIFVCFGGFMAAQDFIHLLSV